MFPLVKYLSCMPLHAIYQCLWYGVIMKTWTCCNSKASLSASNIERSVNKQVTECTILISPIDCRVTMNHYRSDGLFNGDIQSLVSWEWIKKKIYIFMAVYWSIRTSSYITDTSKFDNYSLIEPPRFNNAFNVHNNNNNNNNNNMVIYIALNTKKKIVS